MADMGLEAAVVAAEAAEVASGVEAVASTEAQEVVADHDRHYHRHHHPTKGVVGEALEDLEEAATSWVAAAAMEVEVPQAVEAERNLEEEAAAVEDMAEAKEAALVADMLAATLVLVTHSMEAVLQLLDPPGPQSAMKAMLLDK